MYFEESIRLVTRIMVKGMGEENEMEDAFIMRN